MSTVMLPTPHYEKLIATLANEKLPASDRPRIEAAIGRHAKWVADIEKVKGNGDQVLGEMVALLNEYRNYIDVELVFDSPEDFLYRQKGQLKLDNSVIEEFLPRLLAKNIIPELAAAGVVVGPTPCFSSVSFASELAEGKQGGGLLIRTKNQDFAIAKPIYLRASHKADLTEATNQQTFISYVSVECKTNLDKTMFQEACATAHDTKSAVLGAKYYLLCEWLDMTPQSTAPTDIDEIIILRKARRINSNVRAHYSTYAKRRERRGEYVAFLEKNPFRPEMVGRFIGHIREQLLNKPPEEKDVIGLGYF